MSGDMFQAAECREPCFRRAVGMVDHVIQFQGSTGQGPGFVKNDIADMSDALEHIAPFDQQTAFGGNPSGNQNSSRGRQPEGAGAGDDQDRSRGEPGGMSSGNLPVPVKLGQQCQPEHHPDEP